ncbi:protein CROWDED NUCLEI 2-like [Nicotiana sylvestris]|uniref:protein CROWDED NUCLEI 2-like n=1 Tax=Nicotiana sylvestris TaxID=4096 RepID=UPI00388C66EF
MIETVAGMPATMGVVDEIPNFRGWVKKLLSVASMDDSRGISAEAVAASRISLDRAQEIILGSLSKRKATVEQDSEEEEEQDGGSLIKRSRARRRIISNNEASPPHSIPPTEPVEASLVISDDDTPAAAVLTPSTVPPTTVQQTEVGPSSGSGAMKEVIIEVLADGNLLRKSGGADVWLKPLISPIERAKLESHNYLTWMNDLIQSSLKINLVGTEMMKRVSHTEPLMHEYQVEADNRREQYENLQIDMEALEENKCTLEHQLRVLTSELAVEKASSNQAGKDKNLIETSFSEQLSKASEEIRELKALLSEKEAYAGELVQTLTQTQEDLWESSDKVCSLESSHASLQVFYDFALVENKKLKSEIAEWEKDYDILEDKTAIEVSWAFLNTRHDTLVEVSQENFNLEAELAKIKETIEKTQQIQDFPSPMAETSENIEDDMGSVSAPIPSSQVEPAAADVPTLVPSSTPQ